MSLLHKVDALAPLYRNCLFRSEARVEAHEQVAKELADHVLRWRRGAVDTMLCKGQLHQLQVYALRYGAEVEVTPQPFGDFALVHTSLSGGAEIESDGQRIPVAEGRTVVLAPTRKLRLHWLEGTRQLILRVPHALLREVAGQEPEQALTLAPGFLLPHELGTQWELIAQSLLNLVSTPQASAVRTAWLDHFERNVALFLLSHQPMPVAPDHTRIGTAAATLPDTVAAPAKALEAVHEYMLARLSAPIALEDLARVARVSPRTLNTLCHQHLGLSPMEWLRNLRLDAVRTRLLLQPDASITETALSFGFGHLGRFAGFYAERFQERPRDTQLRQRRSDGLETGE
jgi:AraC-like DNA-binding protein